jgi:hypothetical protein
MLLLIIWNALGVNLSVDLVYIMLGISVTLIILNQFAKEKISPYVIEGIHLLIFVYLSFAMLAIGANVSKEFVDLLIYIFLLLCVWSGLGYTGLQIKRLLKL